MSYNLALRRVLLAGLWVVLMLPQALRADAVDDLLDAMGVPEILLVMRDEGLEYGREMAVDMFPGGTAGATWDGAVSRIYETGRMELVMRDEFRARFGDTEAQEMLDFFQSEEGAQIIELEIGARKAMVDDAVEEDARAAYRALEGGDDPRLAQIVAFVQANDLVEANVVGAMNASFQFYLGLVDGGALDMTEGEILSDVWSQEDENREDTIEWLYGFLLLAYGPLRDATLDDYIALSETQEGRALNTALFAGFNKMYDEISYALGRAAAEQMRGQDL